MNEKEKEAIRDLIDSSNISLIGDGTVITSNKTINTILNLIENLRKENEELKKLNKKHEYSVDIVRENTNLRNQVFNLEKENEELKLYNNSITSQLEQMTTEKFKEGWIHQSEFKDFIPVQKVKNKIEEYKNVLKTCNKAKDVDRIKAINERILELEELLEGRK